MNFKTVTLTTLVWAMFIMLSPADLNAQTYNSEIEEPPMTIISGFKGGTYHEMAMDMQKWARKAGLATPLYKMEMDTAGNEHKVPTGDTIDFLEVKDSDGSYYNFLKINKVGVDVTFLQYDVLLYEDLKDLKRRFKKTEDIRILLPMGKEEIHLITTKESGIEEFSDLKKKDVAIGSHLQGTNVTAKFIKEKLGKDARWDDVEVPYTKAFRLLFNGSIDAFFFVGAAPIHDLDNLPKSMKDKIKLISLPQNEDLKEAYGEMVEINSEIYSWVTEPVKTYAVKTVLVTHVYGEDEERVENISKLIKLIKDNKDNDNIHPEWQNVKFEEDPLIEWDYHSAAKALF